MLKFPITFKDIFKNIRLELCKNIKVLQIHVIFTINYCEEIYFLLRVHSFVRTST